MDHDGTNVEHLRRGFICDDPSQQWSSPSFSPNGRRIVVAEWGLDGRPYAFISVMGVDGSNERLAFNSKNSISPSIGSPDWGPEATGAPSGRCAGARVTIAGTELDDRIRGTNGPDVIQARRGDDVVVGRGGRDRICGGPGDDRARGGNKADRLLGGPGDDVLRGGPGPDVLIGGKGFDRCFGGKGQDTVRCERSA